VAKALSELVERNANTKAGSSGQRGDLRGCQRSRPAGHRGALPCRRGGSRRARECELAVHHAPDLAQRGPCLGTGGTRRSACCTPGLPPTFGIESANHSSRRRGRGMASAPGLLKTVRFPTAATMTATRPCWGLSGIAPLSAVRRSPTATHRKVTARVEGRGVLRVWHPSIS
jgi:hypothetical protein